MYSVPEPTAITIIKAGIIGQSERFSLHDLKSLRVTHEIEVTTNKKLSASSRETVFLASVLFICFL